MHRNLIEIVHEFGFRVNLLHVHIVKERWTMDMPAEMGGGGGGGG